MIDCSRPAELLQQEDADTLIFLVGNTIRREEIEAGHFFLDRVAEEFGGPIYDLAVYRHKIDPQIGIKKKSRFFRN